MFSKILIMNFKNLQNANWSHQYLVFLLSAFKSTSIIIITKSEILQDCSQVYDHGCSMWTGKTENCLGPQADRGPGLAQLETLAPTQRLKAWKLLLPKSYRCKGTLTASSLNNRSFPEQQVVCKYTFSSGYLTKWDPRDTLILYPVWCIINMKQSKVKLIRKLRVVVLGTEKRKKKENEVKKKKTVISGAENYRTQ